MLKKFFLFILILLFSTNLFAQKIKFPPSINFQVGDISKPKAPAADFKSQKEITLAKGYSFVSCSVYFAGAGFPSIVVASLNGSNLSPIQTQIDICRAGSTIVFSNIKVKGSDGVRTIDDKIYMLY
jgi:hypothetical protein